MARRGLHAKSTYPSIYTAYMDLQRAVTMNGWKLILYPGIQKLRLYHVAEDPREMRDLSADPAHAERVQRLYAELLRWQGETGDALDLTSRYPDL